MKIAIAQLNPTVGALASNAQQILAAADQAVEQGARMLLTPELSLCGYPPRDLLLQPDFVRAMGATLAQLAQSLPPSLAVLVGTVIPNHKAAEEGGKPLFNSMALLSEGSIQRYIHKQLLPTYDVFDEDRYFEPGRQAHYITIDGVRMGITICEDLWNDEEFWGKRNYPTNPIADLAAAGVDLIINLSASPFTVGKPRLREAMLSHSARRYGHAIIYVNQVGGNDDLIFDGGSFVVDRFGEVVCRARAFAPEVVTVDMDPKVEHLTGPITSPLTDPEAEIWAALVLGVRDYAQKCGFQRAVLGLSGGIDSALVAAIAATALGADHVLGVLMPSPYSSDHSVHDALALAANLGIHTQTIPIADLMQSFDRTLSQLFAGTTPDVTEENLQSRIRGNLLMAIANKFGHLLLSTGNKSEMAVGYCTLYGDMNGGLAVIADVPKTWVYRLCRWLNHTSDRSPVIPENILTKPPSAELRPGQVDQDSLPPYDVLDDILERLIHHYESIDQLVAAGHDRAIATKVVHLVNRAEFKRKQAPPGLKITDRAFGTGWRMPIAKRLG
ncbi:MAG: NAD+ synthase [Cyanobacteria bacterium]|nr:NAD+ synthase [Cyanobacteriota bacterium]MDW8202506.1 NAD+ synthase [Cyanobacteriota bacterium SKYGB_h_bin112]